MGDEGVIAPTLFECTTLPPIVLKDCRIFINRKKAQPKFEISNNHPWFRFE